jgi:hypothetical protein
MRRVTATALMAAALALALGAPAEARDRCAYKSSKTLRQTSKLRLYTIASDRFYVCVRANGRRFRVDDRRSRDVTMLRSTLTSAGSFAAVAYTDYENEDAAGLSVTVVDLRSGTRRVHIESPGEFTVPRVLALVLRTNGAAAWVYDQASISTGEGERRREVHAAGTGAIRTLDAGPGIDPASLALDGSRLSWTNDGAGRSATI